MKDKSESHIGLGGANILLHIMMEHTSAILSSNAMSIALKKTFLYSNHVAILQYVYVAHVRMFDPRRWRDLASVVRYPPTQGAIKNECNETKF